MSVLQNRTPSRKRTYMIPAYLDIQAALSGHQDPTWQGTLPKTVRAALHELFSLKDEQIDALESDPHGAQIGWSFCRAPHSAFIEGNLLQRIRAIHQAMEGVLTQHARTAMLLSMMCGPHITDYAAWAQRDRILMYDLVSPIQGRGAQLATPSYSGHLTLRAAVRLDPHSPPTPSSMAYGVELHSGRFSLHDGKRIHTAHSISGTSPDRSLDGYTIADGQSRGRLDTLIAEVNNRMEAAWHTAYVGNTLFALPTNDQPISVAVAVQFARLLLTVFSEQYFQDMDASSVLEPVPDTADTATTWGDLFPPSGLWSTLLKR